MSTYLWLVIKVLSEAVRHITKERPRNNRDIKPNASQGHLRMIFQTIAFDNQVKASLGSLGIGGLRVIANR